MQCLSAAIASPSVDAFPMTHRIIGYLFFNELMKNFGLLGNRLTRLIPSLHFFMRSINSDSDSDSADVNFIGLDFGDSSVNSMNSNSNSSAESDSDSDNSSDDSSDSSDGDQSVEWVSEQSVRSRSPSPDSQSDVESVGSADSLPSNRDDYNGFSDSESDVVSIISLHSNDSDSDESRVSIPLSAFADYQSLDEIDNDSDSDSDSVSFDD